MDIINGFLNLTAPFMTFFAFCFFLPPFYFFKFLLSIFSSIFSENLQGKVVIITGASSGIGEHLAYEYGSRGACLALAARRKNRLQEVAELALELGSPDVITVLADVSQPEDCRRIVDDTISHFGRLDHLVNNAGIASMAMFENVTDITTTRTVMDINFWGPVYMTRAALPYLKQANGKIVVMSSAAAWLTAPRMSIYNASKAALWNFFDTLRIELGRDIGITIVTPGYIESELTQGKYLSEEGEMIVDQDMRDVQIGVCPVGSVTDCARAIVRAVCRGQKYVTEPSWFKVTYLWKVFCPEIIEYGCRLLCMTGFGTSEKDALNKKILDMTGTRAILYPESIKTSQIKSD
ncbi:PREDICTED: 11-beta-hydroxysteroid dehydrogenase 1B [Tarenaya hassleriana]|uniref:11-beta-hydroxysteroid dehydrogenase 1B n=1 Tax=Tarenaya hassleriana TaxID=28532 RepID=UPI00053CA99E|nr:PREDICTED: 11-beta-hydroxysteroid dehydrogenase 1B [Tarenaya hassleriana]